MIPYFKKEEVDEKMKQEWDLHLSLIPTIHVYTIK